MDDYYQSQSPFHGFDNLVLHMILLSDVPDDNSQTVISAPTTDHSCTPSPQKTVTINTQSPVYSHLPPPSPPSHPTPSSLNIFTPKPFRSTASINVDSQNNHEPVRLHSLRLKLFLSSHRSRR